MAETEGNGASGSNEEEVFEKYSGDAESFQSDTRRYLMEHLLDEYGNVGQAVSYNLIQNVVDNRSEDRPLKIRFEVSTKDKRFTFLCSGTTGVTDWERYNSLHREGVLGVARRGEGAKVLIPIAGSVRTETKRLGDTYLQSIWRENQIWRSDIESERGIFAHFPPSELSPGSTLITAYGLFDEVGDRRAGIELSNIREMARIITNDWWLFLQENPSVSIVYAVDGEDIDIKPWEMPDIEDSKKYENIEIFDHKGRVIGKIETVFISLAKIPLKDTPPPAVAFSTGTHIVTYQTIYAGPNSSKCFGYVKARFLLSSETSNHFSFKSTSAWRLVREKLLYLVNNFMSGHLGAMEALSPKDLKAITDVTDQINKLIADRFPDWHPGGGYKPKVKKPERPLTPFIRKAATDSDAYKPGSTCNLSFEIVNPDRTGPSWRLEARVKAVSPSGNEVYHKTWKIELASGETRSLSDLFPILEDAEVGSYLMRFSLMDQTKSEVIDERRVGFEVGEENEETEELEPETEEETSEKQPKKEKPKRKERKNKGPFALNPCKTATFPMEEDVVRESYFDSEENRVILNDAAPTFELSLQNTINWKYHIARCTIEELARLKISKEINVLEREEVTREKCIMICEDIRTVKSTFMSEWARLLEKKPKDNSQV